MCDKFNTPRIPRQLSRPEYTTPMESSESDNESVQSVQSTNTESSDAGDLTLVAEFDELIRLYKTQRNDEVEDAMLDLVHQMRDVLNHLRMTEGECRRLQQLVEDRTNSLSDVESKLNFARKMVDQEKRRSKKLQDEKDELKEQIQRVKEFLFKEHRGVLHQEVTDKLAFLNGDAHYDANHSHGYQLGAIPEVNTTGSLLSDLSYSRSEDDLDTSAVCSGRVWKKPRISTGPEPPVKKRRSSTHQRIVEINNTDSVRATTTVHVPKHGPITATSVIESVPQDERQPKEGATPSALPADIIFDMWQNKHQVHEHPKTTLRQHSLQAKTIVLPDTCGPCEKKLRFGKTAFKCKDCRATCHPECKHKLPLPCIPYVNTPTRNLLGLISDFTPTSSPMVPALIVHCINELESRGLRELGLYRIPGSEREVKQLKEKFLRGKGSPNLRELDIHVICGTVKDFLRNLQEPLITFNLWRSFVHCVEGDQENVRAGLFRLISELPQPNRDTLAYMMLHLRTVAESPECKMPISNLAKVFGPTIVGYSSANPNQDTLLTETRQQNMVMESIMNLSTDYWSGFVNLAEMQPTPRMQQTPSTDSLLRPTPISRNYMTPHGLKSAKRKQRIFTTPPIFTHNS